MNTDRVNSLLQAAGQGDHQALNQAWPDLYRELHDIAARQMSREQSGHLLQTTAIVHEAYCRLSTQRNSRWQDRNSFLAAAAMTMRRVLIDIARREKATKRGGKLKKQRLTQTQIAVDHEGFAAIEIHEALKRLADFAPEQSKALELMIFGGITGEEVATALNVSPSTVDRRIRLAKAWLRRELTHQ